MSDAEPLSDLEILEELRNILYNAIRDKESQPKVGDLLKVIELKRKLSVEGKGEKQFWDMVNKIREKELNKPPRKTAKKKSDG